MWPCSRDPWAFFPEWNILWPLFIHETPWFYGESLHPSINQVSITDLPDNLAWHDLPRYDDVLLSRFHTYFISEHLFDVK